MTMRARRIVPAEDFGFPCGAEEADEYVGEAPGLSILECPGCAAAATDEEGYIACGCMVGDPVVAEVAPVSVGSVPEASSLMLLYCP